MISITAPQRLPLCLCLLHSLAGFSQIKFTDGKDSWDADKLGNHRAAVECGDVGRWAKAKIEWRRRDEKPEEKGIIITDAHGGVIKNVSAEKITREEGVVLFEPTHGKGIYYIYYMPYADEGPKSPYPKGVYRKQESVADQAWVNQARRGKPANCRAKEIQSINAFNSFDPMEVIATRAETMALIKKRKAKTFLLFPEDRVRSIRMKRDIPQRWLKTAGTFHCEATAGERFSYQLGVLALKRIRELTVVFHDLTNDSGGSIPTVNMSSLSHEGVAYDGKAFRQKVSADSGAVRALWCLLNIPSATQPGAYKGKVTVTADGDSQEADIRLVIQPDGKKDGNISEPEKMTRLHWLNSRLAQENTVIKPYTPLVVRDTSISLLGRKVTLNKFGLPSKIESFFTQEMTSIDNQARQIAASPFQLHVLDSDQKEINFHCEAPAKFTQATDGTATLEKQEYFK